MNETTAYTIRRTRESDIPAVMAVFEGAKRTMRSSGNFGQWINGYPSEDIIRQDIRRRTSYVVVSGKEVKGTFAFIPGIEPTYRRIYRGRWVDDACLYGTIHRIAGAPDASGVAKACFDWCWEKLPNVRIDTHRDNVIMKHILDREGFSYCGIIYLRDGSERLAYQKIADVERMREDARLVLPARARSLAERYGFSPAKIFMKHNRSNWGSCSSKGNINLNINLIRLAPELRDYVILHELCHLGCFNHGPAFHERLEALCVDLWGESIPSRPLHKALSRRLHTYYPV